jgi:hypothetical protein
MDVESYMGVKQTGGESQSEERRGMAAEVLKIDRRA